MASDILIRFSEVLSVYDDNDGLRIKVRLKEDNFNDYPTTDDLPYCFPLLPKHIHINPKIGECVLIFLSAMDKAKSNRFFIGPLTPQAYFLNYSSYYKEAKSLLVGGNANYVLPKPEMNPENSGSCPEREDIAIQGRQNADVVLRNDELRLRCGFKKNPNSSMAKNALLFNREDLSYIQMRYKKMKDEKNREFYSCINMVADRINLLSHDSKNSFTLNDRKDLITESEQLRILKEAHPLPYGDELIEFLKKLIDVFRMHTHPFSMDPPCFSTPQLQVLQTPLNNMLSQSIKIN